MKTLLSNIKTRLAEQVATVRDSDVFYAIDRQLIPKSVRANCIGIKDKKITPADQMGGCVEKQMPVEIYVYHEYFFRDNDIDDLLDVCALVSAALKNHDFDGYIQDVSAGDEGEIRWMILEKRMLITKRLSFEYFKEE